MHNLVFITDCKKQHWPSNLHFQRAFVCDKSTKAQKGENEKDRVYYSYQIYLKRLPTDYGHPMKA